MSSVLINLPSKQVGVLLADCLLDKERLYITNFDADWTTVTVTGTEEATRKGQADIKALIAQITHDIKSIRTYLHCLDIPLLCSTRGENDVTSIEDLFHVQVTFTDRNISIQEFVQSSRPPRLRNESSNYLMHDLHGMIVSGHVASDHSFESQEGLGHAQFLPSGNSIPRPPIWCHRQPDGNLTQLPPDSSQRIESLFQFGGCEVVVKGTHCMVDFHTMTLIGSTGQATDLQRNPDIVKVPEQRVMVNLKGFKTCIDSALANLMERLRRGYKTVHIPCPPPSAGVVELPARIQHQISNYCRQYCIEFHFAVVNGQYGLNIKGAEGYVEQISLLVREFVRTISSHPLVLVQQVSVPPSVPVVLQHSLQCITPPFWQPQDTSCVFNAVALNSPEWNEIVGLMRATMATVRVVKMDRVQNRPLWEKYSLEGRQMSERNRGLIEERLLFHGTTKTDPYKVARSESGIDFRYSTKSRQLMWGSGAYFAVKACYSDRFSHPVQTKRQMMLVSVLTGRSYRCGKQQRPELTRPPQYSGTGELYDTVYGESADSGIYVVYDHCKSCPAYIITYTK